MVGKIGVELVEIDVFFAVEGAVPVLLLALLLLGSPVLDSGLFVMVFELVRVELASCPEPVLLGDQEMETPNQEHARRTKCMAAVQTSAISG